MGARDRRLDALASRLTAAEELGELIATQRPGASLKPYAKYRNDAEGFISRVLFGRPTAQQQEIIAAVQAHPRVVVQAGFNVGKDHCASALALHWAYSRGGLVVICGPVERTVKHVIMQNEVRRFFTRAQLPGDLFELALRLDAEGSAGLLAFTSKSESNLTGFHSPAGVLLIVTEAQGIEDANLFEALLSCVSGEDDRALVYGNPVTTATPFYGLCRSPAWHHITLSCLDHPNITGKGAYVAGAVSRQYVDRIRTEYGEGSAVWQSRILGEFPQSDEGESLVRREWVARAFALHAAQTYAAGNADPLFCCDPARFGADHTALVVRRGAHVDGIVTWSGQDTTASATKILEHALTYHKTCKPVRPGFDLQPRIIVDAPGLGAGVVDALRKMGCTRVEEFNGGSKPRSDKFANRRCENYWNLRKELEAGRLAIPEDAQLLEELTATRWKITPLGKIAIESKDELHARLGRSPDRADALSLGFSTRWAEYTHTVRM